MENLRAPILCDKELGLGLTVSDPKNRIRYPSAAKRAISVKMASESVSEEMRVLYVAMTRARDRLVMTYGSQTLEADLKDIVLRQDFDGGELVCQEAACMGDWVLLAALQRMEAGALHAISGRPKHTAVSSHTWRIAVCQAPEHTARASALQQETVALPEELVRRLRTGLNFRYPHLSATQTPSKRTATDRKGRDKDQEVSKKTAEPPVVVRNWRRPSFAARQISGKEYGNVMHTVMQYIAFEKCGDEAGILAELGRLTERGFLTPEQRNLVDAAKLQVFFSTEIGRKLCGGVPYLR